MKEEEKLLELSKLSLQLQALEQQLLLLDKRMLELEALLATLKELKKVKKGQLLASLDKMLFINCSLENCDEVLVSVGAGVVVKKSLEQATRLLQKRHAQLAAARVAIVTQLQQVLRRAEQLRT